MGFLQKEIAQYIILKIVLYLLNVYPFYEHQQETKVVPFLLFLAPLAKYPQKST